MEAPVQARDQLRVPPVADREGGEGEVGGEGFGSGSEAQSERKVRAAAAEGGAEGGAVEEAEEGEREHGRGEEGREGAAAQRAAAISVLRRLHRFVFLHAPRVCGRGSAASTRYAASA